MLRKARVFVHNQPAGVLSALSDQEYAFVYDADYRGAPVSLTMPVSQSYYSFQTFPPFFEGLLPEGAMLGALLKKYKLDKNDFFGQLLVVGDDVVGAVRIEVCA